MKIILQHDERDCGAACLAMIAAYYKLFLPLSKCRELTKTDKTGTNIYGLTDGAKQINLDAEGLSGTPDDLMQGIKSGDVSFPFIAHIISEDEMLHYVVVFGLKNGRLIIGDPAHGKRIMVLEAFFRCWTGHIVVFSKNSSFKTGNYTRGGFIRFFRLMKGQWRKMTGVLIASLIIAAAGIMGAFVFQIVIDNFAIEQDYEIHDHDHDDEHEHEEDLDVVESENEESFSILLKVMEFLENKTDKFNIIFISLLLLYFLSAVIQFLRGWLITKVYRNVDLRLTLQYYNHIVDLPMSSLALRHTGEYLTRFSDAAAIRHAISGATTTLLFDSLMTIAGAIILFLESKALFAVSVGMMLLYAVLVLLYRKPVAQSNRRVMEEDAQLQSYFKESIDGMETIKSANAGEQVKETTTEKFNRFLDAMVRNNLIAVSQDTLATTVELVGTVLILWIGFSMVLAGRLTIGTLMTFYALLAFFTDPIKNLIELQPTIQTAFVAADRLNDILDLDVEQTDTSPKKELSKNIHSWEAQKVDFRYGNRELTLHDVNFKIQKGERIAIVGESGSGKTTVAKLLLRFFDPESGKILIDNFDIKDYELKSIRDSVAYVSQNTFLFSDTIRKNLILGGMQATEDEIVRACEACRANEFVEKLPLKYDTPLDEGGMNLSGGQRQRIAIARALLHHPQLLILDEATSNLDMVTENSIRDMIFSLERDITCVIIAHRLQTIKSCDRIFVMKEGRITEEGTFDELMNNQGEFFRLWNAM